MHQFIRRIIGFGVQQGNVDGVALCHLFNQAIFSSGVPKILSSDNDTLFRFHRWQFNLRILDIEEIKSIPHTPTSHPFIELLIANRVAVLKGLVQTSIAGSEKLHPLGRVSKVCCWSTRAAARELLAPTRATDGQRILHK